MPRPGSTDAAGSAAAVPAGYSFEDLFEDAACGLLSLTTDGVVLVANRTMLAWTGFNPEDVVGTRLDQLLEAGSRLILQTRCLPRLRVGEPVPEVALSICRAAGPPLYALASFTARPEPDGIVQMIRVAVIDASSRHEYERELLQVGRAAERAEIRLRVLRQATSTFTGAQTIDSLLSQVVRTAQTAFDAAATAVLLLGEDLRSLTVSAGIYPLGDGPVPDGPEVMALRRREIVVAGPDDASDPLDVGPDPQVNSTQWPKEVLQRMQHARVASMTITPLLGDTHPLGVLVCAFGRPRQFEGDDLQLKRALGQQAAIALQRIRLQDQLHHRVMHDQLTGVANRDLLRQRLTEALDAADRTRRPVALMFLDLDGFKAINDQLGHVTGDAVLKETARRLCAQVRARDTVGRSGGDEFIVVCVDIAADAAAAVADRLRVCVGRPFAGVPADLTPTVSVGVAIHVPNDGPGPDPKVMYERADAAMYTSKTTGKNRQTVVKL